MNCRDEWGSNEAIPKIKNNDWLDQAADYLVASKKYRNMKDIIIDEICICYSVPFGNYLASA